MKNIKSKKDKIVKKMKNFNPILLIFLLCV